MTPARLAIVFGVAVLSAYAADPIRLHPKNPHYFEFQGKAVALITSGEHYGAVLNDEFDYRRYLATLSADGMNYTRLFGGSYVEIPARSFGIRRNDLAPEPGRFIAPWARSGAPGYEGGGNKFDLERWNLEYFDRYRDFLADAAKMKADVDPVSAAAIESLLAEVYKTPKDVIAKAAQATTSGP